MVTFIPAVRNQLEQNIRGLGKSCKMRWYLNEVLCVSNPQRITLRQCFAPKCCNNRLAIFYISTKRYDMSIVIRTFGR